MSQGIQDRDKELTDLLSEIAVEMNDIADACQQIERNNQSEFTESADATHIKRSAQKKGLTVRYDHLYDEYQQIAEQRWNECGVEPYDLSHYNNKHLVFV